MKGQISALRRKLGTWHTSHRHSGLTRQVPFLCPRGWRSAELGHAQATRQWEGKMAGTFKTRSFVGSAMALVSLTVVIAFVLLLSNSARALNNTSDHWQRFDLTGTN